MSNLDKKLNKILSKHIKMLLTFAALNDDKAGHETAERLIEQIKQAFADEEYTAPNSKAYWAKHGDKVYIVNGQDPIKRVDMQTLMTGQEWYDRFEEELANYTGWFMGDDGAMHQHKDASLVGKSKAIEAAKRAAGIE